MPAISFDPKFLDALLSCEKQQTTRAQTSRIKVGDVCTIYNQQRRRITDKPLRRLTADGCNIVYDRVGGAYPEYGAHYWAHFLGKVKITEVYDIHPCEMSSGDLDAWALADGFKGFHPTYRIFTKGVHDDDGLNMWFQRRYGDDWMHQLWTVVRWNGWLERYFEPYEVIR